MFSNGKKHRPKGIHFEIIPMIDVMMILVLFLSVMAFLPQVQSAIQTPLPGSGSPDEVTKDDIMINLDEGIKVNGKPVASNEMINEIRHVMGDDSKRRVVIAANKNKPYEEVVKILSELQQSDIRNVALATEKQQP